MRSVLRQSYTNIECIIVDDATRDDSIVKCERLISDYHGSIRFRILHHEVNRGLSAARNTGTDAATGDYLFYLDSDDEISSDCIEKLLVPVMCDDSVEMVQGNCIVLHGRKESLVYQKSPIHIQSNDEVRRQYLSYRNIYVSVWNKLIKRSLVLDNKIYCKEGIVHEDYLWLFYLTKYLKNACLCDSVTYYHPIRQGSIVTSTDKKTKGDSFRIVFEVILHNLTTKKEKEELNGYLYLFCKRYLTYIIEVPAFHDTCRLYMDITKKYNLWYVYVVLGLTYLVSHIGNPIRLFSILNSIRWKVKKMAEC